MTDPRKERFKPYLRVLADKMGLRDWTVGILDEPPNNSNHAAEIDCRFGRKVLWISLSEYFLEDKPENQRVTLVHELVHAHLAPMHELLHHLLTESEFTGYKIPMEYAVDGIAEEWSRHLPLPIREQSASERMIELMSRKPGEQAT